MTVACVMPLPAEQLGSRQNSEGLFSQKDGKLLHEREPSYRQWTPQELVPGLRELLTAVGLASFIMRAEAWCLQSGAAFLSELIEDEDTFADFWDTLIGCSEMPRLNDLKKVVFTRVLSESSESDDEDRNDIISWSSFLPQADDWGEKQAEQEEYCASHNQMGCTWYQSECAISNEDDPELPSDIRAAYASGRDFVSEIFDDQQEIHIEQNSQYDPKLEQDMRMAFANKLSADEQVAIVDSFNNCDRVHLRAISIEELMLIMQSFGFELYDQEKEHVKLNGKEFDGQIPGQAAKAGYIDFDSFCALMTFKTIKYSRHRPPEQHEICLDMHSHYHSTLEKDMCAAFETKLSTDEQAAVVDSFNNGDRFDHGAISHGEFKHILQSFGFELHDGEKEHVKSLGQEVNGQFDADEVSAASCVEFGPFCALMTFKMLKRVQHPLCEHGTDLGRW